MCKGETRVRIHPHHIKHENCNETRAAIMKQEINKLIVALQNQYFVLNAHTPSFDVRVLGVFFIQGLSQARFRDLSLVARGRRPLASPSPFLDSPPTFPFLLLPRLGLRSHFFLGSLLDIANKHWPPRPGCNGDGGCQWVYARAVDLVEQERRDHGSPYHRCSILFSVLDA